MKKKKENMNAMHSAFYNAVRPELAQQMADGSMLDESKNGFANLSEKQINKIFNPNRLTQKLIDAC